MQNPFRYFNSSPEVIRLAVMMYIRYPTPADRGQALQPPVYGRRPTTLNKSGVRQDTRFAASLAVTGRRRRNEFMAAAAKSLPMGEIIQESTAAYPIWGLR